MSHPLPGSGAFAGDVVARVHSLGAEGRKRALPALEACCLTACAHWSVGAVRLVDAGGVALFVAFLSNELGALRGLAAATLANLICCVNVKTRFWTSCEPVMRDDPSRRYYPRQQLEWPSTSRRGPSRTSPHKPNSSACARPLRLRPI